MKRISYVMYLFPLLFRSSLASSSVPDYYSSSSSSSSMARFLTRPSIQDLQIISAVRSSSRFLNFRCRSNKSAKAPAQLVEVDLSGVGDGSADKRQEGDKAMADFTREMRKLEDAINLIMVKRSAPDWLPFLPGSSYWVPPIDRSSCSYKVVELVRRIENPISKEEALSLTTVRGWPSTSFFVEGLPPLPFDGSSETDGVKADDEET